jgi:hypothetical protein
VTVERLQSSDARELDGVTMFGRFCQKLGRGDRRATLNGRDGLDEVRYRLTQRRQLGAILQHDRLGKTQGIDVVCPRIGFDFSSLALASPPLDLRRLAKMRATFADLKGNGSRLRCG